MQTVLLDEDFTPLGVFPPTGWTTDCWTQSDTNGAGGTAPEARVYKYDQYYHYQYYDNYIMTPSVDASACDKVILEFKFSADVYYPNHCYFYVHYRNTSTDPWVNITPWLNPLSGNFAGSYTVIIHGDPICGSAFQVKWEYIGYYYYYNYFHLDDVKILCCDPDNQPPSPPVITGPTHGQGGNSYTYTFTSTDPDGPFVTYYIDWDDGPASWSPFQESGVAYRNDHTWIAQGIYVIKAKAKDICDAESDWSFYEVYMPKNKMMLHNPFMFWLFDCFPIMFPKLR
jgi:hypothetical protein